MKKGFTMIELIFVIVILGILAAVAIPRLAATRNDATASTLASTVATCINDAGGEFLANGSFDIAGVGPNVMTASAACNAAIVDPAGNGVACYGFQVDDAAGTLIVTSIPTGTPTAACDLATQITDQNALSSAGGTTHTF